MPEIIDFCGMILTLIVVDYFDIFTKDNVIRQIIKDNTRLLPQRINIQTRNAILERVNSSKTIEKGNIDKISAQLLP